MLSHTSNKYPCHLISLPSVCRCSIYQWVQLLAKACPAHLHSATWPSSCVLSWLQYQVLFWLILVSHLCLPISRYQSRFSHVSVLFELKFVVSCQRIPRYRWHQELTHLSNKVVPYLQLYTHDRCCLFSGFLWYTGSFEVAQWLGFCLVVHHVVA